MMNVEHRTTMRDSDPLVKGVRRDRAGLPFATRDHPHRQHVSIGRS